MNTPLPFTFDQPQWLVLLPLLLPLVWWIGRNSLAGLSRLRGASALALRLLLVTGLVVALARPQWNRASDAVAVYFVKDISDSIPAERKDELNEYVRSAVGKKPLHDRAGLIYFGADASCEQPPSELPLSLERQGVVERSGTDIAKALRLAASTFPLDTRKRIVLVSDGNQNRSDAVAEAERLRAMGVRVDVLPVEYRYDNEILLEKADLPGRIYAGLATELRVLVRSTHATEALLEVHQGGTPVSRSQVDLKKGVNHFTLPVAIDKGGESAGVRTFRVSVTSLRASDDRIHDNNVAYAFTRVAGPPQVLYIDGNLGGAEGYRPLLHEALVKGLRLYRGGEGGDAPAISLTLRDAQTIPDAESLVTYDCIVIDNLAAEYLGPGRMERIRALVDGQGTGLVMIGGEHAFGAGNYRDTPIEKALPVDMDLKHKKVMPNGALVLVIDRSGSMDGRKLAFAKAAASGAVDVLGPHDYIGIIDFDSAPNWLVAPVPARDRQAIRAQIATLGSGGGTDIIAALREALAGLIPVKATVKHIVLLSDGQSDSRGLMALMQQAAQQGITVSTIGIGEKNGQPLMQEIALRGGGRFHYIRNPSQLPRIFIKESMVVKRALLFEETFTPAVADAGDELLQPVPTVSLPPLHGYVGTTAKPKASVPLVSTNENEDPILAHWRYGLGHTVAFTSDAKNRWGRDWLAWEQFANFWSNLVYRVLREQPANLRLITTIEGARGRIVAHAIGEDGEALSFLDLTASVTDPDAQVKRLRLRQTGAFTYETEFEADKAGRYEIAVRGEGPEGAEDVAAYDGAAKPFSAESMDLAADMQTLHRIAGAGGGRLLSTLDPPEELFSRDELPAATAYHDCWGLFLALFGLIFPLDVLLRRVMIDHHDIFAKVRGVLARRDEAPPEDERLSRLVQVKRRAMQRGRAPELAAGPDPETFTFPTEAKDANEPARPAGTTVPASSPKEAPVEVPEEAATYTERLLKAKRRKQHRR